MYVYVDEQFDEQSSNTNDQIEQKLRCMLDLPIDNKTNPPWQTRYTSKQFRNQTEPTNKPTQCTDRNVKRNVS